MVQFIAFSVIGLIIIFLCYLIKYKKQAFLISGYNEDEVADKNSLCEWFGGVVMWSGILAIVTGAVLWKYPGMGMPAALIFVALNIIIVIIAIRGARKFKK